MTIKERLCDHELHPRYSYTTKERIPPIFKNAKNISIQTPHELVLIQKDYLGDRCIKCGVWFPRP